MTSTTAVTDRTCTAAARRPGTWSRTALVVLVLAVLVGAGTAPARAQSTPDADALGLEASRAFDGWTAEGTWGPVEVRLQPEAPFRGRILVAAAGNGSEQVATRDVEVGAGVTKEYVLLVPPTSGIQVQVVPDGAEEGVTRRLDGGPGQGFLVGVLGDLDPGLVPTVTNPTTDRGAVVAPVTDRVLALGPRALAPVSTLVVDHADMLALSPDDRGTVARAVAAGAHLVVVGTTSPDLGLPWQTAVGMSAGALDPAPGAWGTATARLAGDASTGAGRPDGPVDLAAVGAGKGRVVTATWQPEQHRGADAVWEHLLQPTAAGQATARQARLTDDVDRVFSDATGAPVSLGWLAGFLVAYLVVVGPLLGLVFRGRRRPELAWVAVPVVTALFATAAFFGASGARPRVGVAGHVATWVDGLGTTMTVAGVRSPQPGEHTVALPGEWDVVGTGHQTRARTDAGDGGDTTVRLDLPGLSFGAVLGHRPTDAEPPLDVEVAVFDSLAQVEVANVGPHDLDDVQLRLATRSVDLADVLPAGETVVESVELDNELPSQRNVFGEPFDAMPPVRDRDPDPAMLGRLVRWSDLDGAPGLVWVTATSTTDLGLPRPSVDGTGPADRGTFVAVGAHPTPTDDRTLPVEVQRDVLLSDGQSVRDAPLTVSGQGPAVMRFHLPREAAVTGLDLQLDRAAGGGFPGGVEPVPDPVPPRPAQQCGLLERRDGETGDLVSSEDFCGSDPCPPGATMCSLSQGGPVVEGEACFPDGDCETFTWEVEDVVGPRPDGPAVEQRRLQERFGGSGMQVWDHGDRRWVDTEDVAPATHQVDRWLGPLGDVWVRTTGQLVPFDLAPQGVGARLGGAS